MPIEITMPALSPTMEEGNLARWLKKVGDAVRAGDVLAEIETDKATMEVEAIDEGTLAEIRVADGTEGVKVGTVIGVIAGEGEEASPLPQGGGGGREAVGGGGAAKATPAPGASPAPTPPPALRATSPAGAGEEVAAVKGYGANPAEDVAIAKAQAETAATGIAPSSTAASASPPHPPGGEAGPRINASPLARRLAEMRGVSLGSIEGTGPGGRIVKADVDGAGQPQPALRQAQGERVSEAVAVPQPKSAPVEPVAAPAAKPAPAPAPAPAATPAPAPAPAPVPDVPHEAIKLSNMRKVIARRLTESKQTVPHYYLAIDCRLDALLKLRAELNAAQPIKLSVNDLLIKALAVALIQVPDANVSYTGDQLLKFSRADISVAVAIPAGLITPIIVGADSARLTTIAAQMKDLAARAKDGKLQPHEYQGGTASLSNLGMYGIKQFEAVINPPQGMILAVGAGDRRPWVEEGALTVATVLTATGSFDHRAIDGATGAQLMAAVRDLIERPLGMLA